MGDTAKSTDAVLRSLADQIAEIENRSAVTAAASNLQEDANGTDASDLVLNKVLGAARKVLLASTARRPLSEHEATKKLAAKFDDNVVTDTVLWGRQQGVLNDATYARLWVEDRGRKRGYGESRLRRELRGRGIDDATIDVALNALADVDPIATARELAQRRVDQIHDAATTEPASLARRLATYLQRRGYQAEIAMPVAREVSGLSKEWE